jgi:hypothetical protein
VTLFARAATAAVFTSLLAVGPAAMPSAADDGTEAPADGPTARLVLRLTPTGNALESDSQAVDRVTLTCGPDGGTHPTPEAACDSLRGVGGAFEQLPDVPGVACPTVFDPHVARADGFWIERRGGPVRGVRYEQTFGNRCDAAVGTDNVFDF